METEVIKLASSQGIWASLSIALIFYILKSQEKRDLAQAQREEKYQEIIRTLTDRLEAIEEIKSDIDEIKSKITLVK